MKIFILFLISVSLVFGWKVKKGSDTYLLLDDDGNLSVENGVLFVNEIRCNGGKKLKLVDGVLSCSDLPILSIDNGQDGEDKDSTTNEKTEIWVHLDKAAKGDVTFKYKTVEGTAKAGDDFKEENDVEVTISEGDTDYKIEIEIVSDDNGLYEAKYDKEKFSVEIYDVSSNADLGDDSGDIYIVESDTKPVVKLKEDVSAGEDKQPDFTVEIDKEADVDVSVDINISNGGGSNDNTSNDDFDDDFLSPKKSGTVTIDAGKTSATVNVKVTNDDTDEDDEDYTVQISNPTNADLDSDNDTKKGTIEDDDSSGWI